MSNEIEKKDELAGTEQAFMTHLIELRDRLVRAIIAVAVVAIALAIWPGPQDLYDWLARPLIQSLPEGAKMIAIEPLAPFLVSIQVLLMIAVFVALPFVLYQLWAFIAPGLYKNEKLLIFPLVVSSTLLFFSGMAFCYYFVFIKVFSFIVNFAPASVEVAPDMTKYVSLVMRMFIAFGVAFEVPIVVIILVRMGMVSIEKLRSSRGYVIVGSFVIAAVITPPDVISQLALAIPMCILYELGILVSNFITPKVDKDAEAAGNS